MNGVHRSSRLGGDFPLGTRKASFALRTKAQKASFSHGGEIMTAYLIRRFLQMIMVVWLSTFIIYGLLSFAPGGPLSGLRIQTGNQRVSDQDFLRMEKLMGLDKPWHLQYIAWLTGDDWMAHVPGLEQYASDRRGILRLDFGTSWKIAQGKPVLEVVGARLKDTLILMSLVTAISLMVAIPIGIYSAVKQYSTLDYFVTSFSYFGIAMPVFWFGLLLILLFSLLFKKWGLPFMPSGDIVSLRTPPDGSVLALLNATPGSALDRGVHLIMPAIVLSLLYMASWTRYMRTSMLEVLRQDYVRTARAKGLIERLVITRHAFRNALIPIITIVVYQLPAIFSGAIVTETVFNYKAMGYLYILALNQDDWPVIMALLFITAILVVIATLVADLLYTVVDPRITYS